MSLQTIQAAKPIGLQPSEQSTEKLTQSSEPIKVIKRNVYEADIIIGNHMLENNGALEMGVATGIGTLVGMTAIKNAPNTFVFLGSSFLVGGFSAGVGAGTSLLVNSEPGNNVLAGMASGAVAGATMAGVLGGPKQALMGAAVGAVTGGIGALTATYMGRVDDLQHRFGGAF